MFSFLRILSQAPCDLDDSKFGIPTWYKYLDGERDALGVCGLKTDFNVDTLVDDLQTFSSVGLAVIEILLFFAGLVAVAFVIYGGFRFMTSNGEPDQTAGARNTILNALIGLVIAIMATTVVRFIARSL